LASGSSEALNKINDSMYTTDDKTMLVDVCLLFESDLGKKVLGYLETLSGAMHSLEPEEVEARETGKSVPICPIGMAKRNGQRAFFWRIIAMIGEGERLRGGAE